MKRLAKLCSLLLVATLITAAVGDDQKKKPDKPYGQKLDKVDVIPKEWKTTAAKSTPAAVDAMLLKLLKQENLQPAPLTTDEHFLRRVTLDLTGKVPTPADIKAFVADKSKDKRAELIDRLLASEDFNKHWARYWRDVVTARATEQRSRINEPKFEAWLAGEMKKNTAWSTMVKDMITAEGELRYAGQSEQQDSGAEYFLLTHLGPEAGVERAADTARVFMGIQIQCAQCHDHPSDIWKREQFHELAAFYARTRERPIREEQRIVGFRLFAAAVGEHRMTDLEDPKKSKAMEARFLTGERALRRPQAQTDESRRKQLAQFVTSGENYWFYANFVNRLWADLMGQGFYNPVDNMGPLQEATYPELLLTLSQHFKASGTDVRDLYRLVMNSQAYQRQTRLGESADQHLHFAGSYPSRLTADELWNSLAVVFEGTLQLPPGAMRNQAPGKAGGPAQRLARRFGFEGIFRQVFAHDPTAKQDEIESTIPQALMLMNNPLVQGKLRAGGDNVLVKLLKNHDNDRDAVEALYLKVLARTPTKRELTTSLDYIRKTPKRTEAYEDLFWVLINSAEFQTKR
jgi:hypothetical protein